MRVLAAAFAEHGVAARVLHELRRRYGLSPGEADVAPLGMVGQDVDRTVLADRFDDAVIPDVRRVVQEHGGEVVAEVDGRWTHDASAGQVTQGG